MKTVLSGWEFEICRWTAGTNYRSVEPKIVKGSDGSVHDMGLEFRTREPMSPFDSLQIFHDFIKNSLEIQIDQSAGIHLHFSVENGRLSPKINRKYLNNLYAIGSMFEDRIFQLVHECRRNNRYCLPLQKAMETNAEERQATSVQKKLGRISPYKGDNNKRYCWLNFVEIWRQGGIRTVEFRLLGNTKRIEYIAAWFRLCLTMVYGALILDVYKDVNSLANVQKLMNRAIEAMSSVAKADHQIPIQSFFDDQMAEVARLQAKFQQL